MVNCLKRGAIIGPNLHVIISPILISYHKTDSILSSYYCPELPHFHKPDFLRESRESYKKETERKKEAELT